jgi:hypothetical protein
MRSGVHGNGPRSPSLTRPRRFLPALRPAKNLQQTSVENRQRCLRRSDAAGTDVHPAAFGYNSFLASLFLRDARRWGKPSVNLAYFGRPPRFVSAETRPQLITSEAFGCSFLLPQKQDRPRASMSIVHGSGQAGALGELWRSRRSSTVPVRAGATKVGPDRTDAAPSPLRPPLPRDQRKARSYSPVTAALRY